MTSEGALAPQLTVPESMLKKRKRDEQWELAKKEQVKQFKLKSAANRKAIFKRDEQYIKEYRQQREAKLKGGFYVSPEAKLLFSIHIRAYGAFQHIIVLFWCFILCASFIFCGINDMHPKTQKILQLLCPRQIFNGGFLKVNKATMNMLSRVEPYVIYGFLENIEDLIHEIYTVGPHFKESKNFVWPFKLSAPLGGLKKKRNHFIESGDARNHGDYVNAYIKRMN
ncbi:hypothetical protein KP509_34G033900 [Ceratopteris richardii]|uniref:60S ribosomal protein L7 n=1 Tax=Ceratopteris richardii TaxID=49495 RepID=A0A8T2QIK7_CERRI|nr:hypothetical protein KP509_34G033900 [Ceratopteris richardii]